MKYLVLFFFIGFYGFSQNIRERKIKKIIDESIVLNRSHVSFSIQPVGQIGKSIRGFQTSKYMTPASNNKLLTFLATIETFDSIPVINHIKINDTLHVEPTGYPLLFHPIYPDKDMEKFLNSAEHLIIHWNKNNVIKYGSGWAWDDYKYYFSPEISSFPVYGNLLKVFKSNNQIIASPINFEIIVDYSIKSKIERNESKNIYLVNPNIISSNDTLYFPFKTSKGLTVKILNKNLNINVKEIFSKNLNFSSLNLKTPDNLYRALLWDSDNLIAESLLLMSGKKLNDEFSTLKTINIFQNKWKDWLPDPVFWFDGSGLSRYNMITSRSIVSVLQKIYFKIGLEDIKRYFATFGELGNLSEYYRKSQNLIIYAKTGNIKNNSNISGFLMSKRGNWYCFSLMINHFELPVDQVKMEMGKILDYLYQKG